MPYCSSCGEWIPDGQGSSCSMCYGDISYGSDGYYRDWAEEQMMLEEERIIQEQRSQEEYEEAIRLEEQQLKEEEDL